MESNLCGRTALITGGTGYIGQKMAHSLACEGANIAILDREPAACELLCDALKKKYNISALPLACELSNDAAVHQAAHNVAAAMGGLDILINNAAFVGTSDLTGWVTDFEHQSTETWRKAMEVNLTAPFTLCREAAPYLARSGKGSIINIGSTYAIYGPDLSLYDGTLMGNPAAYGAAKAGLLQLTRWLATVLAPKVRVNSICPGGVWRGQPEIFVKRYEKRTPLGRMATEDDICGTVVYFASDMSCYVTGQNIIVDGGFGVW